MELRGKSISYGSYIKKETKIRESKLLTKIKELEENFSNENIEELENLKSEIKNIQSTQLKGCMIRSKFQWTLQGEKPSKYFLGLEKNNAITKTIYKLKNEDDSEITDQTCILNTIASYYQSLFKQKKMNVVLMTLITM